MHAAALLVIDVQQGLDDPALGQRNNPDAEANMALLLQAWRRHGWPVIHVHHDSVEPDSPLRPGLPGNAVKPEVQPLPGETCFRKTVNSAFIGTGLEQYLREQGIASLVIVGLTTDHCVSASASMASDLGYGVTVVADATAAHERPGIDGKLITAEEIHDINLASLNGEFCRVVYTSDLLKTLEKA